MTTTPEHEAPTPGATVDRRRLFRTGAVLAGATGVAAMASQQAHAADGDPVVAGALNESSTSTTLTVGGTDGAAVPALALRNADGPSLSLETLPANWAGQLDVGVIAGSELGPLVGVETLTGPATTYLATGVDLANLPTPFPTSPTRLLDLRKAAGRTNILRKSSATAVRSDGKLAAGQWIDVAVTPTGPDYAISAVFANVVVISADGTGHATVYAPGVLPVASTINYVAGQILANGVFVGTGSVLGHHAVRIYSNKTAWFILDVTGAVTTGNAQPPIAQATAARAQGGRQALVRRVRTALSRLSL